LSGKLSRVYENCRKNGELAFFWQYCCATLIESGYILANNPELFFGKITEEQWQNFEVRICQAVPYREQGQVCRQAQRPSAVNKPFAAPAVFFIRLFL